MTEEQRFELSTQAVGALPIVGRFLDRLGLVAALERHLPAGDGRVLLTTARTIVVLILNLCLEREPLYGIAEWAQRFDPRALCLEHDEVGLLSDDRVGRALDQLFDADRASLLTELVLGAIREFEVDCSQLHNDSTSITLHGEYLKADGRERGGQRTAKAARGHSKDHRGDLKQLVSILTVSADGAVPLAHRLADANTTDDQTHVDTWEGLRRLLGRADFLYVADSKLCTREQMGHIDSRGGRFVTVLPRSRTEDARLREWMTRATPDWAEAERRPGKRKGSPDDLWRVAEAPFPTVEGYRITWVNSSSKQRRDETARAERIERARRALEELSERLAGPRARVTTRVAAEEAAAALLASSGAERWVKVTVSETVEERYRQEKRGRPGKDTRYRKITKTRFALAIEIDSEQIRYDAASDGCFPLVSNGAASERSHAAILAAYRYQPNLEKRHHELKSVQDAAPVQLKSPFRIEALFSCQFIALLVNCLIERELRRAMTREGIHQLPLYHEQRACTAPTAVRIFDHFADVQRHQLTRDGDHIQTFEPELTALQRQLLELLGVPASAYTSHRAR
ncbi:MAG: IS1634 family transposase [Actinobacteria bacterium]|nr:IS1634 family transposase [Actinomycetota bacterium]